MPSHVMTSGQSHHRDALRGIMVLLYQTRSWSWCGAIGAGGPPLMRISQIAQGCLAIVKMCCAWISELRSSESARRASQAHANCCGLEQEVAAQCCHLPHSPAPATHSGAQVAWCESSSRCSSQAQITQSAARKHQEDAKRSETQDPSCAPSQPLDSLLPCHRGVAAST
jgi:hypothetical protein